MYNPNFVNPYVQNLQITHRERITFPSPISPPFKFNGAKYPTNERVVGFAISSFLPLATGWHVWINIATSARAYN